MNFPVLRNRMLLTAALSLILGTGSASAAVTYDVAVGMNVGDDARIFLNLTNQTWRPEPTLARRVIQESPYPEDDFPVILFLAYHSHRSPTFILNLRREGYRWTDVFFRLNVSPSVLFAGIDRDPGPPYGRAWGYWKNHRRPRARVRYRFSDRDIVGLVKVQTASRHLGASPYRIIEGQRKGGRVEVYTASQWREKHGRKKWNDHPSPGPGRGQGKKGGGDDHPRGKGQGHHKGPKN